MREPHHPPRAGIELADVLHALSDPARLAIVRTLRADGGELPCGAFDLGLSRATLSHHLRVLREAGVVRTRPEGRKRLVSLRVDDLEARFPGLIDAILDVPESASANGAVRAAGERWHGARRAAGAPDATVPPASV
ncbi:helix-turn-helix transcriptional regulator [Thermoleophilum album]|uniref:ArsR/SmtB family transcription factor n=1 Tax=Thermoleophilum album TaxID=29539 RepID=UPI00237C7E15|nr:metalloregulator ArsR/SmtB family transcription factor [Thermoleophilum album]WDT93798.1 helix-turn-helix transcriptional regulator [Thermoleophilum album]